MKSYVKVRKLSMQLYFYGRNLGNGKTTIYYQIAFDGTISRQKAVLPQIKCKTECWDVNRLEIVGDEIGTEQLVRFRQDLFQFFWAYQGDFTTAQQIQDAFSEKDKPQHKRLLELFEEFIDEQERLCRVGEITPRTLGTYNDKYTQIRAFLQRKQRMTVLVREVDMSFVRELIFFLKTKDRPQAHNQAMRTIALLKRILETAVESRILDRNPLYDFGYHLDPPKKDKALNEVEFRRLSQIEFESKRVGYVRDWFVFMAWTMMTWADMQAFDIEKNTFVRNNSLWIQYWREKENKNKAATLPFFPEALAIWKKYKGEKPKMLLKDFNMVLKQACMIADVRNPERITSYSARHTVANIIRNWEGITDDTLSFFMGNDKNTVRKNYTDVTCLKAEKELGSKLNYLMG